MTPRKLLQQIGNQTALPDIFTSPTVQRVLLDSFAQYLLANSDKNPRTIVTELLKEGAKHER